jgi:ankyrin repeat protein
MSNHLDSLLEYCKSDSLCEEGLRERISGLLDHHQLNLLNDEAQLTQYPLLHEAVYNKNVSEGVVQYLLDCIPGIANVTSNGDSVLHRAFENESIALNIVQRLIDAAPESLRQTNTRDRLMPLHVLCLNEGLDASVSLDILKLLIEKCPESVRHVDNDGCLPIHFAASGCSSEFCRVLLEAYPRSERITTSDGFLPVHAACQSGHVATAEYLINLYPESINVPCNEGFYPTHYAVSCLDDGRSDGACVDMVRFLLTSDPGVASQKFDGELPLHEACCVTNKTNLNAGLKIIQLLYDVYPEAITCNEKAMKEILEGDDVVDEVKQFLAVQADYAKQATNQQIMTTPDKNGQLPLHKALCNNIAHGSLKLLVKGNPSALQTPDNLGSLPLHLACEHQGSASDIEYLLSLDKTTLIAVDKQNNTPLHYACRGARFDTITLLLDKFAAVSVSKANIHNKLPIHLLFEGVHDQDNDSTMYVETVFRLLREYPMTIMHA